MVACLFVCRYVCVYEVGQFKNFGLSPACQNACILRQTYTFYFGLFFSVGLSHQNRSAVYTFHFMKYECVFCCPTDIPPPFFLRLPPTDRSSTSTCEVNPAQRVRRRNRREGHIGVGQKQPSRKTLSTPIRGFGPLGLIVKFVIFQLEQFSYFCWLK